MNIRISSKGIHKPRLVVEPGRSIVGESGITLYSVGNIRDIKGIKKYVCIDGGMFDNIRPALYQAEYEGSNCLSFSQAIFAIKIFIYLNFPTFVFFTISIIITFFTEW